MCFIYLTRQTFCLSDNENSSSPWVGGIEVVFKGTQGGVWKSALFLDNMGGFFVLHHILHQSSVKYC